MPTLEGLEDADSPFTQVGIERTISKCPLVKAPGESGLLNDLMRHSAFQISGLLHLLFHALWKSGRIPSSWHSSIIQPVPQKGDITMTSNNRPISLAENMHKLFERCILSELTYVVEPLDIAQGGFRMKRSTIDQVASLHELVIHQRRKKKPVLVCFLDIKAAYDSVHQALLWKKLIQKRPSLPLAEL